MLWFIIALISFFLFAIAAVADKFLLTKSPLVPPSYAFFVCLLGGIASTILIIFAKQFYFPVEQSLNLLLAGGGFYLAILLMYWATVRNEISRINPLINSLLPIFIYLISLLFVVEFIKTEKIVGALLVIGGGYVLSQIGKEKIRLDKKSIFLVVMAAIMFAVSYVFTKIAYQNLSFLNAFIWIRWAALLAAIFFTTIFWGWPKIFFREDEGWLKWVKRKIALFFNHLGKRWVGRILSRDYQSEIGLTKNPWPILIIGQTSGAFATLLMQYAIKLGSVTLVTALQGLQYVFLLFFTIILSKRFPQILKESTEKKVIRKKILALIILIIGVFLVLI